MAQERSLRKRTADGKVKVAEDAAPTPSGADLTRQFVANARTKSTKRPRKTRMTTLIDLTADDGYDDGDEDFSQYTSTGTLKRKPKPKAVKARTIKSKTAKVDTTEPQASRPDKARTDIPPTTPPTIESTKHWGNQGVSTPPTIKSTKHWGPLVKANAPPPVPPPPKKVVIDHNAKDSGEKRSRKFRDGPTQDYRKVYDRALTQRMFVLDRVRDGTDECPTESMSIAGTTGNIYTVNIGQVPKCNCPHLVAQCKHIVYAIVRVLHAPEHLQYQLAFLESELREMFAKAPPIVLQTATASSEESSPNRKPIAEDDDCPICCMSLLDEAAAQEHIVYCKAACGNNLHKECFDKWAATKRQAGSTVTCPYCRTAWQQEVDLSKPGMTGAGGSMRHGYVNIAAQLGLSGHRDTSTYHSPWLRQQERAGFDIEGRDMMWNPYDD